MKKQTLYNLIYFGLAMVGVCCVVVALLVGRLWGDDTFNVCVASMWITQIWFNVCVEKRYKKSGEPRPVIATYLPMLIQMGVFIGYIFSRLLHCSLGWALLLETLLIAVICGAFFYFSAWKKTPSS